MRKMIKRLRKNKTPFAITFNLPIFKIEIMMSWAFFPIKNIHSEYLQITKSTFNKRWPDVVSEKK